MTDSSPKAFDPLVAAGIHSLLAEDLAYQTARERQCLTNMTIVLRAHKLPHSVGHVLDMLTFDPEEVHP